MSAFSLLRLPHVPLEGVCLDFVLQSIRHVIVNPVLLALALLAALSRLGHEVPPLYAWTSPSVDIVLSLIFIHRLGSWCSERARNNWLHDHYDWSKETVVITGGAGGIGTCLVDAFLQMDVTVIIIDIQPRPLGLHPNVHYFECDIRSYDNLAAVADKIRVQVGHPTVLINNAGVVQGKPLLQARPSDIRLTFDVNTLAAIWAVKEFLPNMVATNHGMVVTISSFAAWLTLPSMVDYSASKNALLSLHEGLTAELTNNYNAPKVRTVLVQPGHVKTPLFAGFKQGMDFVLPSLEPESIAKAVVRQAASELAFSICRGERESLDDQLQGAPDETTVVGS
ncbi:hypothetical protein HIM_04965 [Hirsutella minnesotensis 3608]|uniref:Short-chain dehydrogenase/reductase 3 n=1 Tax=Hirsutella minnesotensis 3608 TaxID=1043627 RepID=A0A0F7ZV12_9HYPO|nr:hypothetical protein HIM_04965 [Hirsutella minnesotensis 3608]